MATIWAKIIFISLTSQWTVQNIQMCKASDYMDPNYRWVNLGSNPNAVDINWTCVVCDGTDFQAGN